MRFAGEEHVQNACSDLSHTHTATSTCSYRRVPNRPYVKMNATHRYSPPKTGGITLSYLRVRYTHKLHVYKYAILFCSGLSGFQGKYRNYSKSSTNQFWKIELSCWNFRGKLPCARLSYFFLTNLVVYRYS